MISEVDLKKTINTIIKDAFPKHHLYGQGDVEGYKYPAIFHELRMTGTNDATLNTVEKNYFSAVQYIPQGDRSEADDMRFYETLRNALCCIDDRNRKRKMCIKVTDSDNGSDRYIKVKDVNYGYVGEAIDIMQVGFTLSFYDYRDYIDPEPEIEDVNVRAVLKEVQNGTA